MTDLPNESPRASARFVHVLPLAFVTYGLAFLDRVNYSSAESRMRAALHLTPLVSSLLVSIFYLGYCAFQIPGAAWATRRSVKPLVFWAMVLWGLLSSLTGVLKSVPLLVIDRVLLGAVEGVVLPAMLIFLTRWFTRPERSRANAVLILANPFTLAGGSALSGFLIDHFNGRPLYFHRLHLGLLNRLTTLGSGRLEGWQMVFIAEGLPSLIWAGLWLCFASERPRDAGWLSPGESAGVQARLDAEQAGLPPVRNYAAAFADSRVILLSLMYFCFSAVSYGVVMWLPQMIEDVTRGGVASAGVIASLTYVAAIPTMLAVSWIADRSMRRKQCVWGSMAVGAAACFVIAAVGPGNRWIAFSALVVAICCLYTPCGPLWAWMADILPSRVVGESMALVNSVGALGGFVGSFACGALKNSLFPHSIAPVFIFLASGFVFAGALTLLAGARRGKEISARGFEVVAADPQLSALRKGT